MESGRRRIWGWTEHRTHIPTTPRPFTNKVNAFRVTPGSSFDTKSLFKEFQERGVKGVRLALESLP